MYCGGKRRTCCRLNCNWYSNIGDQLSTFHPNSGKTVFTRTYDSCGWAGVPKAKVTTVR